MQLATTGAKRLAVTSLCTTDVRQETHFTCRTRTCPCSNDTKLYCSSSKTYNLNICDERPSCSHLGQCKVSSALMSKVEAKHHKKLRVWKWFLHIKWCKMPMVAKAFTLIMRFSLSASPEGADIRSLSSKTLKGKMLKSSEICVLS